MIKKLLRGAEFADDLLGVVAFAFYGAPWPILAGREAPIRTGAAKGVTSRLAYVEVLPGEKQEATVGFLLLAVAWFNGHWIKCCRVLSDNGSAYRSRPWKQACEALGLTPKRTRP